MKQFIESVFESIVIWLDRYIPDSPHPLDPDEGDMFPDLEDYGWYGQTNQQSGESKAS